jgi:hypothetical protein
VALTAWQKLLPERELSNKVHNPPKNAEKCLRCRYLATLNDSIPTKAKSQANNSICHPRVQGVENC